MKLFNFEPTGYGVAYATVADSEEEARVLVRDYISKFSYSPESELRHWDKGSFVLKIFELKAVLEYDFG